MMRSDHCLLAALIAVLINSGCQPKQESVAPKAPQSQTRSVPLRVAVFGSDALASQIATGWEGATGQPVDTALASEETLPDLASKNDVIVLPSRMLGTAVRDRMIVELPESFMEEAATSLRSAYTQLRDTQIRWQGQEYGVSLGAPAAVVMVRDDFELGEVDVDSLTYDQFYQLAEQASVEQPMSAEPLADGQAAISLLRRASVYSGSRWLFDRDSFEPLIDNEPFVRALKDMIKIRPLYPAQLMSSREIWKSVSTGSLKIAIGWPNEYEESELASVRMLVAPHSSEFFEDKWQPVDDAMKQRCFFTGDGLIATVSSSSRQSAASRSMLLWLGTDGHSALKSHSEFVVANGMIGDAPADANFNSPLAITYDPLVRDHFSLPIAREPLRIPGAEEYLAALDMAVLQALSGNASAQEALSDAKSAWNAITERRGRDLQKHAWKENRGVRGS